jgi:hypothetical protein
MAPAKARQARALHRRVRLAGAAESRTRIEPAAEPTSTHAPWGMLKLDLRQAAVAARAPAAIDIPITTLLQNDRIRSITGHIGTRKTGEAAYLQGGTLPATS